MKTPCAPIRTAAASQQDKLHKCPSAGVSPARISSSFTAILLCLFVVTGPPLTATEPDFTLVHCLELARLNNPELLIMTGSEDVAAAEVPAASAETGPSVALSATGRMVSVVPEMVQPDRTIGTPMGPFTIPGSSMRLGDNDTWEAAVTVSQTFYAGGRLSGAVDLARLKHHAVTSRTAVTRSDVDLHTATLYLELARLVPLQKIARVRLDTAQEHSADVRDLMEAGVMTDNEGLKADLRVSETEEALIAYDNLITSVLDALARMTGYRFNPPEEVPLPQIGDAVTPEPEMAIADAINHRPEIAELDAALLVLQKQSDLTERINRPVITGYGKAAYGKPGPDFIANEWLDYYEAGLQVRVNLWDHHRVDRRMDVTALEMERVRRQRLAAVSRIELDVRKAITRIRDAGMRLNVADRAILQAEENFRVTRERFNTGILTHTDYLDAETALHQVRCNRLILLTELKSAWLSFHASAGHDLLEILQGNRRRVMNGTGKTNRD